MENSGAIVEKKKKAFQKSKHIYFSQKEEFPSFPRNQFVFHSKLTFVFF